MKRSMFVLAFLVLCVVGASAQNTYIISKWNSPTTSWDTTRVAATTTSTKCSIVLANNSATSTDTLFYAFNAFRNDTSSTKSVGFIRPGEARDFPVVGLYMINLKGKTSGQATRLEVLVNLP